MLTKKGFHLFVDQLGVILTSKLVEDSVPVLLTGPHHTAREVWLVDAVRKLLSLQTEPSVLPVIGSVLARETVVCGDEVASVELDSGLVSEALQPPA